MDNNVAYGLLIGLIIVVIILIFQAPEEGDASSEASSETGSEASSVEHFNLDDACEEMFHIPHHRRICENRIRSGTARHKAGVIEAHKKYQKNKQDDVDLPEELYFRHMNRRGNLSKFGKCRTVFWKDEDMAESCAFKPNGAVNALHKAYWGNRFNNVHKSDVEYQAFLNAATELVRREQRRRS